MGTRRNQWAHVANETCLLLTSTIHVEHQEFLRPGGRGRTDVRLRDYAGALESWITQQDAIRDIVFFDNSGYPLDRLREVVDRHADAGKRVELHSVLTTGYSKIRGRSFGELDIMRNALAQSALMRNASCFVKVTGRVFVPNIDAIMSRVADDFDVIGRLSHNLSWLDTVCVLFRRELFAQRLLPYALDHVNDQTGHHIERVLASACLHSIADGSRWYPFPAEPRIQGVRGVDGRPYPSSALRARIIDAFAWGHHRALDVARNAATPHPRNRWAPSTRDDDAR
jgi:hypothetical protein